MTPCYHALNKAYIAMVAEVVRTYLEEESRDE